MVDNSQKKYIGTLPQKKLLNLYKKHVNGPKVRIFKGFGLAVIPGERNGIRFKTLAGAKPSEPPLEIINCRSSGGVFNLGHCNPKIAQVLKDALDEGLDLGDHMLLSEQRALLGKKLAELMPGDISKTTFGVSGGEAIDTAIKFSRAYTKRKGCVSAIGGYHGHTGFALLTGDPDFRENFLWSTPDFKQVPFGDAAAMRKAVTEEVACVILETIPATGGVLIAPEGYFQEVREICDEKGAMMIIDEVQAGLGRTGHLWAIYGGIYPNEKVVPDFMVLAKGTSAGIYPLSICSYKPIIEKSIFKEDPFIHISTTGGSDLGCAVTSAMLDIQSDPQFLNHVKKVGTLFGKGLSVIQENNFDLIKEVRGRGLMWGVEFFNEMDCQLGMLHIMKQGVLQNYCGNKKDTLIIMPPLISKEEDIEEILSRIKQGILNLKKLKK
ncbi:MAG: aminotransferase class III-fold pyridoxal phosphate-dependent enzyme [Candidatus Lokiarchaeota archaeon]|nr:aminotransferase class III-fold pyridoxal phosphate-dependent enzyme [Candidatus Lokiarchaeota archaeon]MBD3342992.1 aminotransferase class III-fold pyridoxal phosphate-dependent enzyme [Candidatus Lokiarchaeota archaeon]